LEVFLEKVKLSVVHEKLNYSFEDQ
jgi:hypothetical protein